MASGKASAISRPIPASMEPCPGKQKAMGRFISDSFPCERCASSWIDSRALWPNRTRSVSRHPPVRSPFDQTGAPGEACTHPGHEHQRAVLEPALGLRVREGERNRAGRRVAVAVDVDDHLLPRDPKLLGGVV